MTDGLVGWMGGFYLWAKAIHLILVIFWMAALFMLPRFYAYHTGYDRGSTEDMAWQERERRLLRIIMNPAMIGSWIFGLMLIANIGFAGNGWLHLKLLLVLGMSGYHGVLSRWRKDFVAGRNTRSSKFYRLMNEIPTLMTIPIVILVIVKPF
jgi:protoporphyrinogen IX oxidase